MRPSRLAGKREQVREFVLDQIAAGLRRDDQLWTEHALAERLGVSKSTVRKAIEELAGDGVIYQQQGRGTFVKDDHHPDVRARVRQRVRMLGYVSPYVHDDRFMRDISFGVEEGLDHDRFLVVQKHIHIPTFREEQVLPRIVEKVDGLILLSTMSEGAREYIARLHERHYPLVLIDRYLPDLPITFVGSDNDEVGILATEHLLSLGHRRILHLSLADGTTSCRGRAAGYTAAMRRAGLEPWIEAIRDNQDLGPILDSVMSAELPTAIFAVNDAIALGLYQALRGRCIRVPHEISLIGVDGNPDAALCEVPITTVAQPKYQIGFKAAGLLQDLVCGRIQPGRSLLLQPKLIVRQSTAPVNT